ncbi:MAG TPA: type VI secretion protein IcmF/TssM N-terminal domain-containing protein [Chthoniobacter sp.]|nr:type VI secretion protein IcmF/TssM N-terminal domain-containing protein [Chthoniobacter sp.]
MEVIYFLLRELGQLPRWTRWIVMLLMLLTTLGFMQYLSPMTGLFIGLGILAVVGMVGLVRYFIEKWRGKKAAEFGGELQGNSEATPGAVSDPARRARLADLRKNFEKGLEKYASTGKNLYKLPWYVIVGEPGAGKTEAIRNSGVGFPPGMQDEFQGVGGTINMNWWFTNDAVILDTAGRLLFEEVPPGTTSEWQEFLGLLKKNRADCPINGLFLAIPAESLIKDDIETIKRKAGRIAQQLEGIQKILDIRFPCYVVITKADLLNGFREFFDELNDPVAAQQMLGWSNPEPLDRPFCVKLVEEYVYTVVERLRRRRFGLMMDPIPRQTERRVDEVDRLYALPHSIHLIAPSLQQYLLTIFTEGEWTAKPLFLRGIYFTSSMREGSALDQELATALQIDIDQLPEGRGWERERSYFLHDLFTEKSFHESKLVTRATNTKQLLLKRKLTLFGAGTLAALLLLGFSVLSYQTLRSSVGQQSGFWVRASEGWNGNIWKPIVTAQPLGPWKFEGAEPIGPGEKSETRMLFKDPNISLVEYHSALQALSAQPIRVGLVFRPLASFGVEIDRDRKRAERVLFEASVIKPLLDAARAKMIETTPQTKLTVDEERKHAETLLALIRVEAGIARRLDKVPAHALTAENFLVPLTHYVSGTEPSDELLRTMTVLYSPEGAAPESWPPDWMSGGVSLAENTAIDHGLDRFISDAQRSVRSGGDAFPVLDDLVTELKNFMRSEDFLYDAARGIGPSEQTDPQVFTTFSSLQSSLQNVDLKIAHARDIGLFSDGPLSLAAAYEKLLREGRSKYVIAKNIQGEMEDLLNVPKPAKDEETAKESSEGNKLPGKLGKAGELVAKVAASTHHSKSDGARPIFGEILARLQEPTAAMAAKFKGGYSDAEVAELRLLDDVNLADSGKHMPSYKARWTVYSQSIKASPPLTYASSLDLITQGWKPLTDILNHIAEIRTVVQQYDGKLRDKVIAICNYSLHRAETIHSEEFCKAFLSQARGKLGKLAKFPLVGPPTSGSPRLTPDEVASAGVLFSRIEEGLNSPALQSVQSPTKQALSDFSKKIVPLKPIVDALLTPDKSLRMCRVVLLGRQQQFELSGQRTGITTFRAVQLRAGTTDHGSVVKYGTPGLVPTDAPSEIELGRFTLYEPFHFHFHRAATDPHIAVDMPAPSTWTSLELLNERQGTRIGDGTRWRVSLSPEPGKIIWVEMRFDKPFPDFDAWPTAEQVGLNLR